MYRVLIVEDDPMVTMINEQYIKQNKHFQIAGTCKDGKSALDYLSCNPVDLIILDVMMPKINGYKISRLLKYDSKYKDI